MYKAWLVFTQILAALVLVLAALLGLDRLIPGLLPFDGKAVTIHEVDGGDTTIPPQATQRQRQSPAPQ